jgi:2-oxoglutarate dehydrogenase E1 component
MTMCAEEAFVVAQPSTPASYFHLLRRHSLGEEHKPLIVFTPKSMLKRKDAASQPADFTEGSFRPFVSDDDADPDAVETLLMCSGRITWDVMAERAKQEHPEKWAVARVEQLYPTPSREIAAEIARFPNLKAVRWVQDEPANMGPWPHYQLNVWPHVEREVQRVSRPASASPSVGTLKRHSEEQAALLGEAFAPPQG